MTTDNDPLFSTKGEKLLYKWACRDIDFIVQVAIAVEWMQQPWYMKIGRKAPSPWPKRI